MPLMTYLLPLPLSLALLSIWWLHVIDRFDLVKRPDQLWPHARQQFVAEHLFASHEAAGGKFDRPSERNGNWAVATGPSANISGMGTNGAAQS